jgi:hypothetical protein
MRKVSSLKKTTCGSRKDGISRFLETPDFLLLLISVLFLILIPVKRDEESMIKNIIGNSLAAFLCREN